MKVKSTDMKQITNSVMRVLRAIGDDLNLDSDELRDKYMKYAFRNEIDDEKVDNHITVDYYKKGLLIRGPGTKALSIVFKGMKGKWNKVLYGWIFSVTSLDNIIRICSDADIECKVNEQKNEELNEQKNEQLNEELNEELNEQLNEQLIEELNEELNEETSSNTNCSEQNSTDNNIKSEISNSNSNNNDSDENNESPQKVVETKQKKRYWRKRK